MVPIRSGALALIVSLAAVGALGRTPTTPVSVPTTVLIRVVEAGSERALPNAEVSASPLRRLTDARGEVRFTWPAEGRLAIRVRQLGFQYEDRTLTRGTSLVAAEDTVVVPLSRAPFALPQVATHANSRCTVDPDPATAALSSTAMDLLRLGAEQYNTFSAAYPFRITQARRTVRYERARDEPAEDRALESTLSQDWGDRYHPGRVLRRTGIFDFYVSVLFVSTLADSSFWDRHCFVARGVESRDGRRTIRLDFSPARDITEVEWAGSVWIDSAASVLRRVDFRLANLRSGDPVKRLEGYTTFAVLSPYIAMPESTVAWWWNRTTPRRNDGQASADVLQALKVLELAYLKEQPPASPARP